MRTAMHDGQTNMASGRTVTAFVRAASAVALGRGFNEAAIEHSRRWRDHDLTTWLERSTVAAVGTGDAEGLVLPGTAQVLGMVRSRTLLGRLGRVRRVPFSDPAPVATGGAVFGWVGEAEPVPVGRLAWQAASLPRSRGGGIVVLTKELLEHSSPSAEALTREELVSGLAEFLDRMFVDPAAAGTAESPASITNGVTPIEATGDPRADLIALVETIGGAMDTLDGVVLMIGDVLAFRLATMTTSSGAAVFPGLGADGGTLFGLPVLTSAALGSQMVALHAPSLLLADDGELRVDAGQHASVEMDSDPDGGHRQLVSMWQTNSVAIRVTRYIGWQLARAGAVARVASEEG